MKRVGHLWPQMISFMSLARAHESARRRKRTRPDVAEFEFDLERHLWQLHEELAAKTYQPGAYHTFFIHEPKRRLISAAPYRDRVVHHALTRTLERVFEPTFIHESYACRKRKGTHAAIREWLTGLRLRLHPRKAEVFPVAAGIRFLGYRVFPWRRMLTRENVRRFRRRVRGMQAAFAVGQLSAAEIQQRLVSWLAHAGHGSSVLWREQRFATIRFTKGANR